MQEAAIFVKEGKDNEKFNHHPQGRWSKLAFKILHHPAYYTTHLIVTVLLILLALAENHPVEGYPLPRDHQMSRHPQLTMLMVLLVYPTNIMNCHTLYVSCHFLHIVIG